MKKVLFLAIDLPKDKEELRAALNTLVDMEFYQDYSNSIGMAEGVDYDFEKSDVEGITSLCKVMDWGKQSVREDFLQLLKWWRKQYIRRVKQSHGSENFKSVIEFIDELKKDVK